MRLLVTGAGGLVGAAVCEAALRAGHEVHGIVRTRPAPPGVEAHATDVRDAAGVARAAAGADAVVHTAYVKDDRDVIVEGTRVVAHAGARRVVHVSTDLVFGGRDAPYTEQDEPAPLDAYGAAKAEAERVLPPGAVAVRTSIVFGRPDGPQERLARAPGAAFFTDEVRCPVHVDVLAAALVALATAHRDVAGPLHVAGPEALDRLAFARRLAPDRTDLRGAPGPPGRAKRVVLDSSRARALGVL